MLAVDAQVASDETDIVPSRDRKRHRGIGLHLGLLDPSDRRGHRIDERGRGNDDGLDRARSRIACRIPTPRIDAVVPGGSEDVRPNSHAAGYGHRSHILAVHVQAARRNADIVEDRHAQTDRRTHRGGELLDLPTWGAVASDWPATVAATEVHGPKPWLPRDHCTGREIARPGLYVRDTDASPAFNVMATAGPFSSMSQQAEIPILSLSEYVVVRLVATLATMELGTTAPNDRRLGIDRRGNRHCGQRAISQFPFVSWHCPCKE